MKFNIALLKGDGIGVEIVESSVRVLDYIAKKYNHQFIFNSYLIGGIAIDKCGMPLPKETVDGCLNSDSVLLGAVGGTKWDNEKVRPEKALLGIRKALNLYTNLRPAKVYKSLKSASTLRSDIIDKGFDLVIVRELTGGIYFGDRGRKNIDCGVEAYDTEKYNTMEIERIAHIAFQTALKRRKKVTSVDKANVLETSKLWRETVEKISKNYKEVELEHMLVDNAAMQLIRNPSNFDVVLTSNMFGDILSDEVSQITGSIGLLPSASLSDTKLGLYEPIHGSAPDIAGQNIANPIATILSASMMLRYSFDLIKEADDIDNAVEKVLDDGYRTIDILDDKNKKPLSLTEMESKIIDNIKNS